MTEALRPTFVRFAAYNIWANQRLYDAVATLPESEISRPRAAIFGSILGTLNHILVGDRAWIGRLTGQDFGISSLDQILHDALPDLRAARDETDRLIVATVASITLAGDLEYTTVSGQAQQTPRDVVVSHLFNHQTHHRGQIHQMLTESGLPAPPLDIIYFHRTRA